MIMMNAAFHDLRRTRGVPAAAGEPSGASLGALSPDRIPSAANTKPKTNRIRPISARAVSRTTV